MDGLHLTLLGAGDWAGDGGGWVMLTCLLPSIFENKCPLFPRKILPFLHFARHNFSFHSALRKCLDIEKAQT